MMVEQYQPYTIASNGKVCPVFPDEYINNTVLTKY